MNATEAIDNMADVIDSRDVIARLEHLSAMLMDEEMNGYLPDVDPDDVAEFEALRALHSEAKNYAPDWEHGEALIRDSYFEDYTQQLAEDLDLVPDTSAWPARCIDWEQAARELQMDYTSVDFDGITYWVR